MGFYICQSVRSKIAVIEKAQNVCFIVPIEQNYKNLRNNDQIFIHILWHLSNLKLIIQL
jgi:hypothetical protein